MQKDCLHQCHIVNSRLSHDHVLDRVLDNCESSSATGMFMAPLMYGSLTLTGQGELEMFSTLHS